MGKALDMSPIFLRPKQGVLHAGEAPMQDA
jgi:hypothetical protein